MKYLFTLTLLSFLTFSISAQEESKWPDLDASTMDAEYYPEEVAWRNYLGDDKRNLTPKLKVVYSRPTIKGRKVFGDLVPFGEEWRLGANEATLISFYQAVAIGETAINQGTYSVFVTPNEDSWTFHISSETNIWGNANRDESKTVTSVTVDTKKVAEKREALTMTFQEIDDLTANLVVEWENTQAALPIAFNPILMDDINASPMDVAHYPAKSAYVNYLKGDEKNITPKIQVTYSRPQKNGRNIFGELLQPGSVWRIGANEATEVAFFQDVKVGGSELRRGRYAMFAKLNEGSWDIIFSKDYPIWGAANRDESKDVATVNIPLTTETEVVEALSIIFEDKGENATDMIIAWDTTRAALPITWE